jgi:hypothetical protein
MAAQGQTVNDGVSTRALYRRNDRCSLMTVQNKEIVM